MNQFKQLILLGLAALILTGCSGGSSSNTNTDVGVVQPVPAPTPAAAPPQMILTGVAAIGAALDGALIEVIDASGNLVDVGDAATGSDGSYSVTLPDGIVLPVVIRATPPGGTPLLSIVEAPADGSTDVVANINPVTNLVSNSVLSTSPGSSNADLAGALAGVDPTTIKSSGDTIIKKVFGAGINYDAFATDANFVANDGVSSGSAADSVLDTVARRAKKSGKSIEDTLSSLSTDADTPALLEDPGFQVELVSEMIKGGAPAAELESSLSGIGALAAPVEGEPDVFRTIISVVPAVIETTKTNSASVSNNPDLVNVAIDATVAVISNTLTKKKERFAATAQDLDGLLKSPSFQSTTSKVVSAAITPVLEAANASSDPSALLETVSSVTADIAEQTSEIASGFTFSEDSTDVSDLVSGFVTSNVIATVTTEMLQEISQGTATNSVVAKVGDVNQVKSQVQTFATENPNLITVPLEDLIQTVPDGVWGTSKWGSFNWG